MIRSPTGFYSRAGKEIPLFQPAEKNAANGATLWRRTKTGAIGP